VAFNLFAGFLEIAGQSTGGRRQYPEQEKSDAVDTHAAEFRLPGYHHQINRVEGGKKHTGGDTGGDKRRPEYRDNTLNYRYPGICARRGWICCGFHGLRPPALTGLIFMVSK